MQRLLPTRYFLVMNTFLLSLLLYIDRVCISAAKTPIAESLSLTDREMGWVLSFFALGYAIFQTPSGILADRLGPRKVLSSIVVFWSAFTALTGAAWNYISLLIIRFLFGVSEAGAFPGMSRAIFSWIPLKERGLVNGINFSGSRLGAAFALPLVGWMITGFGWRRTFFVLGIVGVLWAVVWFFWFRDTPEEHNRITEDEKAYILESRQRYEKGNTEVSRLSAAALFGSRKMWLAMIQYFCSNFTFFFCLTWLLPHLREKFQLDLVDAGFYASLPFIFGALGNWFSGWLVDKIYRDGHWTASRRIPAITGFILAAVGLIGSMHMDNVLGSVLSLSVAIFGADMTLSPSWSFCIDIGKNNAGAVSGTMNMAGNIGAFLTALAFPYLKEWSGDVALFFYVGTALNILAVLAWLAMKPQKSLETY